MYSLIFPIHLIKDNILLKNKIIAYEHPKLFNGHWRKEKILRESMQNYLKDIKHVYIKNNEKIDFKDVKELHTFDPNDEQVLTWLKSLDIKLVIHESPLFLHSLKDLDEYIKTHEHPFFHKTFYKWSKFRLGLNQEVLIKSKDMENRERADKQFLNIKDEEYYPTTRKEAIKFLKDFVKTKFELFGKYQDAIGGPGYHSILSCMLNIGLIQPKDVLKLIPWNSNENSVEGFIRQIVGWREYVRMCYIAHWSAKLLRIEYPEKYNQFIKIEMWDLEIIKSILERVKKYGYCNHIERLMVLGNWFVLNNINPKYAYDWFMNNFIDAYEWVMIPNLYGMVYYSLLDKNNRCITRKSYICSFNYIRNQSIKGTKDEKIWNDLFFLHKQNNIQ